MAFELFRLNYNLKKFHRFCRKTMNAVDRDNLVRAEEYSKRAIGYGKRVEELSTKVDVCLDGEGGRFSNALSYIEQIYIQTQFAKQKDN